MDETIVDANARISAAFTERRYILDQVGGVIDGTSVRDQSGTYLFAWHRHDHHLLFYLRRPALDARGTLRQKAISRHPVDCVAQNTGRETTITLRTDEDAKLLLNWLIPELPITR